MPVVSLLAAIVVALCTTFGAATVRAEAPTDQPPLSQPAIDAGTSTAQGAAPAAMTDQLIVGTDGEMSRSFVAAAANAAGADVSGVRVSSGDAATFVVALGSEATAADLAAVVADLKAQPGVAWAEPDRRMFPTIVPNDAYFGGYQWDLAAPTAGRYGIDAPVAWDITTGAADVRTAVVDTGYLDHADLAGRFIGGYDFVSDEPTANDGDARDADAHDPGDWITSEEAAAGYFEGCDAGPSSWHGTHVAGTIGANGNNSLGVAGINWASKIVPVRALGKCGGYTSDIVDAMRWSAGLTVSGVPTNPYPVDVVNLSLGGSGPCGTAMGTAISEITAIGASVVVAAGNSNSSVSWASPANCPGVITVAATGKSGNRASYSNYGSLVTLAAPGGDGAGSIVSTLNAGMTTPGLDDYAGYQGTSMAAPHVAGVVSLMLAAHPTLTPAQVKAVLRSTVTPFPGGSTCTTSLCGSGILHASTAVAATAVAAVPAAPRQPVATWDGTSVVLTWSTVTRTGGSPITDYIVQVSSNSAASWSTVPDGVSTAATATVTGLTPSANYVFRVGSANAVGAGEMGATISPTSAPPPGSSFVTVGPARLVDTRPEYAQGAVSVAKQRYGGATVLTIPLAGAAGLPSSGISAVALNIAVTEPVAAGFAVAYPCDSGVPDVSSVNFVAGQTVANATVTPVLASGMVCIYSNVPTHLVVDVSGWFVPASAFTAVAPKRLVDTRPEYSQGAVPVTKQRYGGGSILSVALAGVAGLPASGIGAVALNVTVTEPVAGGFVTLYPCGGPVPTVSMLNFVAGQTVGNSAIAPVSASGSVCLYSNVLAHLVVDVSGWFSSGAGFSAVEPLRLIDTRPDYPYGAVAVPKQFYGSSSVLQVQATGVGQTPGSGVGAVSLNLAVTEPTGAGFATAYPCDGPIPVVSSVNFVAGQTVPNAAIAPVSATGTVCIYSNVATHLVVDVNGWFAG